MSTLITIVYYAKGSQTIRPNMQKNRKSCTMSEVIKNIENRSEIFTICVDLVEAGEFDCAKFFEKKAPRAWHVSSKVESGDGVNA